MAKGYEMAALTFDKLTELVRKSVTSVPADRVLQGSDGLTDLGIDSITTLNIIMTAAEEFLLDLDRIEEFSAPPATLGELHGMLVSLAVDRAPA
jgi:hypothetical protein